MRRSLALLALAGTAGLLLWGFLFSRYALKRIFASIAKNPEMVLAVSVGWCAAVAATAGALGLSKEMGALVAGLSIAAFPYSIHVTAKTLPLRDFFLTLFFVSLGMKITAPDLLRFGVIDRVIGEPPGGAHADPQRAIASVGQAIEEELKALSGLSAEALKDQRNARFYAIGRTLG